MKNPLSIPINYMKKTEFSVTGLENSSGSRP
jgi:hypothetical protein